MAAKTSFIKFDELAKKEYVNLLGNDLVELGMTPGPTRCVAKINDSDVRIGRKENFPITSKVAEIINKLNKLYSIDLFYRESNGNLIIVGGLGKNPSDKNIFDLPVTLTAHLDEITYMVKNEKVRDGDDFILIPLCSPPPEIKPENADVKILGFRGKDSRKLVELGTGKIDLIGEDKEKDFVLKGTDSVEILTGDLIIQDYFHGDKKSAIGLDSTIRMKALDDRVGSIAQIYSIAELAKRNVPAKAILAGDEEGFNKDVSWARLIRPTFRKYVNPNGLILVCDGFDGHNMHTEFSGGQLLKEALITSYISKGSGAGDPGILSLFRDEIIEDAKKNGFGAVLTTCYASRSLDPKIMDEFPLISFIDWSNGAVGGRDAICHLDESVSIHQVINIIGLTCLAVNYFTNCL